MRYFTLLFLVVLITGTSELIGQNPIMGFKSVSSDENLQRHRHSYTVDPKYAHRLYKQESVFGLDQGFPIDYDQEDRDYATSIGSAMLEFVWPLNEAYTNFDTFDLTRAMVFFDTIPNGYPGNDEFETVHNTSLKIDSIDIWVSHQNFSGNNNTIKIRILDTEGNTISGNDVIGSILWSKNIVTNSSLTEPGIVSPITVYPNFSLDTGQTFIVKVDYIGPINDRFTLFASERDDCLGTCLSETSIIPYNSLFYMNFISSSGTNLSGFNYLVADCDMNGTGGTPGSCEWFGPQNFLIIPYVSKGQPVGISSIMNETITIYPNPSMDYLYIDVVENSSVLDVVIYDMRGLELSRDRLIGSSSFNIRNLSDGVYFVLINNGQSVYSRRVVVSK